MSKPTNLLPHLHTYSESVALDSGDSDTTCQQVYDAEYVAACFAAGRQIARQMMEQEVDRYATICWWASENDGPYGVVDLDLIQGDDLLTIMKNAGLS